MMALLSVALFGCAYFLPLLQEKTKQTLTLTSVKVSKVAKSRFNNPDVEVNAQLNYSRSLPQRYLSSSWGAIFTNIYIADSTGKKHYMIPVDDLGSQASPMTGAGSSSADSSVRAHFQVWLRYFPKSDGKLILHFTAVAQDGFKLPVSVVVRK